MTELKNSLIESVFDRKVIPNRTVWGLDTASRTGWAKATSNKKTTVFEYGFVDVKSTDKYFKYNQYADFFEKAFNSEDIVVIEESFYSRNVKTFQLLSRIGAIAYTSAHFKKVKDKYFILALTARKQLGFVGKLDKKQVQKIFLEKIPLKFDDEDIVDAFVLAIVGITEQKTVL